ncbi:MAG: DNA repair protein RecO [Clostridiales Family XIII bacterium]|jgi:DNA repair protein RecO (recombination protein O)|nr:DNA repair protein RecO [Clostridiales Family XIII bacterium]
MECEGLVFRRTQAVKGRSVLLLFTDQCGKISAGTSISERGKGRSALAVRRFTRGRYQLTENRGRWNVRGAEAVHAYLALAEDYDRYQAASLALEFTEKMLPEDVPEPEIYRLLVEYLGILEERKQDYDTVSSAYFLKAFQALGVLPAPENFHSDALLSALDFVTIDTIIYIRDNPLCAMRNLTLPSEKSAKLLRLLLRYGAAQFDIGPLKSDLPKEV